MDSPNRRMLLSNIDKETFWKAAPYVFFAKHIHYAIYDNNEKLARESLAEHSNVEDGEGDNMLRRPRYRAKGNFRHLDDSFKA